MFNLYGEVAFIFESKTRKKDSNPFKLIIFGNDLIVLLPPEITKRTNVYELIAKEQDVAKPPINVSQQNNLSKSKETNPYDSDFIETSVSQIV